MKILNTRVTFQKVREKKSSSFVQDEVFLSGIAFLSPNLNILLIKLLKRKKKVVVFLPETDSVLISSCT